MAPGGLPYKRPFFQYTLSPQDIEEDIAYCISNTKRRRRGSPGLLGKEGRDRDRETHRDRDRD